MATEKATTNSAISSLVEKMKQERDELKLQIHLAKAEARDEWVILDKKWRKFEEKANSVGGAVHDASKDVGEAVHTLADELKAGYGKIRDSIRENSKT